MQCIFDAVNISSEEVYRRWQRKEIDVAPQLLVNVRRARKERRLKVRHAILAMAQIKDRNSSRMKDKVIRAFMSSIKGDRIEEAQDINLQIDSTTDFMKESGNINLASMSSSVYDSSSKRVRSKTESFDFSMVSEEDANEQSNIESAPGDEEEFHNADVDKWLK
ncbi:hypothetical protein EON65_11155 [archaeon]|nr:MAG: hypothetical protein EON65_11155 [archaeon]